MKVPCVYLRVVESDFFLLHLTAAIGGLVLFFLCEVLVGEHLVGRYDMGTVTYGRLV